MEKANKSEPNPNVESRFEKRLLRCPIPACNKPLAERKGNEVYLLRYKNKEQYKIKLEIHHFTDGYFKISCDCGGGHIFASINEAVRMIDVIAKMEVLPVDKSVDSTAS